ncbi:hypothetical protein ENH_00042330 [Eimeria necatrix]|uniref:Uncharacterized protein n=1 Tax=Eimeria necatrix TaxID=51315 RepID=U6MXR8_9EIME|nr:hypothetical protein ENH_00042330 [Eimeria necatrix]CDJ67828.1 hypothetical protein ENH_00042330 [Eimeria necatrix]
MATAVSACNTPSPPCAKEIACQPSGIIRTICTQAPPQHGVRNVFVAARKSEGADAWGGCLRLLKRMKQHADHDESQHKHGMRDVEELEACELVGGLGEAPSRLH